MRPRHALIRAASSEVGMAIVLGREQRGDVLPAIVARRRQRLHRTRDDRRERRRRYGEALVDPHLRAGRVIDGHE
jgi:hypothetical protein